MTEPAGAATARRGRPRSTAVDDAVVEAVTRLLAEGVSLGELSMEGIARTAGVGKATLYRRWPGKEALLLDVLATVDAPSAAAPPGTSFRDDLTAAVESIRERGLARRESLLMSTMLSQAKDNPELWKRYHDTVVASRRETLAKVLLRGVENGDISPGLGGDLELLVDFVTGPMLARAFLRPEAVLSPDLTEKMVDLLIDGLRPRD